MKTKYVRQEFISTMAAIMGATSLGLLLLEFTIPAIERHRFIGLLHSGKMATLDLFAHFGGGWGLYGAGIVRCLLMTLMLTVLFSLISLGLSKTGR
jgi:hypothetical protein